MTLLGGYAPGSALRIGERHDLRFLDDRIAACAGGLSRVVMDIPYGDVEGVDIGGPGLVKSGGGFAGDGFGSVGALEGMALSLYARLGDPEADEVRAQLKQVTNISAADSSATA